MPRVSADQLDARRRQILDAARTVFAQHGYEGATVRRLEEATGLSRGAIFHHYRDKESLFLALAEDDAVEMAAVVARHGLVQVMRDLVTGEGAEAGPLAERAGWFGTQLELSRRLRTDPEFQRRWAARSEAVSAAVHDRLARQRDAGVLRRDVPLPVLEAFLALALDGLVLQLATGAAADQLEPVLDLVEETVRTR